MEQGNLRCDVNVSLRPSPEHELGTRTETKNVNSLRSVEGSVRYEISRQAAVLDDGQAVHQETRMWQESTGITTPGGARRRPPRTIGISPNRSGANRAGCRLGRAPAGHTARAPPAQRLRRLQKEWGGFTDAELRDVVNAEATGLIEETVAEGCSPGGGAQVVADRTRSTGK